MKQIIPFAYLLILSGTSVLESNIADILLLIKQINHIPVTRNFQTTATFAVSEHPFHDAAKD